MTKIIFFGDSNTYGYDPRGMLGMRYPEAARWTTQVRKALEGKYVVIEAGMNGRMIPKSKREMNQIQPFLKDWDKEDWFVIMLGTNDILLNNHPHAKDAIGRMNVFLEWLTVYVTPPRIIVIGPVPIASAFPDMEIYHEESRKMNIGFEALCQKRNVLFFDAEKWQVDLSYDGVHFSESGHRAFAKGFLQDLRRKAICIS